MIKYISQLSILQVIRKANAPTNRQSNAGHRAKHSHLSAKTFVADMIVMHGTGAASKHRMTEIQSATVFLVFFFSSINSVFYVNAFTVCLDNLPLS